MPLKKSKKPNCLVAKHQATASIEDHPYNNGDIDLKAVIGSLLASFFALLPGH
jgi:hypothetical protein